MSGLLLVLATDEDRDVLASALHEYLDGRWGTRFYTDDDDGWHAPARLFVRLLDAGAKPQDAAYRYVADAVRPALARVDAGVSP
jgi:hypothetical protein